jgi:hypothetical protein
MEYIYKKINKRDMKHVAGTIFNLALEAEYVQSVTNENNKELKFCYNTTTRTLTVLDYKVDFKEVLIQYEDIHHE